MRFLHSMLRVSDPESTVAFFKLLGLEERRRMDNEQGRFTLIFLGVPGDEGGEVELTWNWDEEGYGGGRNFGHLAYQVDDIYETCQRLADARPPTSGPRCSSATPSAWRASVRGACSSSSPARLTRGTSPGSASSRTSSAPPPS
jgi:lactoylglutathione lyase